MPSLKHKWIVWSVAAAVLSIASTVAILQNRPPRFEDRFHRVANLIDPSTSILGNGAWLDNDTILCFPTGNRKSSNDCPCLGIS